MLEVREKKTSSFDVSSHFTSLVIFAPNLWRMTFFFQEKGQSIALCHFLDTEASFYLILMLLLVGSPLQKIKIEMIVCLVPMKKLRFWFWFEKNFIGKNAAVDKALNHYICLIFPFSKSKTNFWKFELISIKIR